MDADCQDRFSSHVRQFNGVNAKKGKKNITLFLALIFPKGVRD